MGDGQREREKGGERERRSENKRSGGVVVVVDGGDNKREQLQVGRLAGRRKWRKNAR